MFNISASAFRFPGRFVALVMGVLLVIFVIRRIRFDEQHVNTLLALSLGSLVDIGASRFLKGKRENEIRLDYEGTDIKIKCC